MLPKGLTQQDLLAMYRWMVLTRQLDLRICALLKERTVPEGQHASTGEEAVWAGSCYGLRPDDLISPQLRSRGARLIRGISSRETMAALLAKATGGVARGRHVSRHMGDPRLGIIPGTASVGAITGVATGAAMGCKLNGKGQVVLSFLGDGATNTGVFHESLNCAALYKLPVVYVCENNQYAQSTSVTKSMPVKYVADRAPAYAMPGKVVDGNDVLAVYEATQEAIARARAGEGPTLLDCQTYRLRGHTEIEGPRDYRIPGEYERWEGNCPIKRFKEYLLGNGYADEAELARIDAGVDEEVEDAVQYAIESPDPAPEEIYADIFAPSGSTSVGEAQQ